MKKMKLILLLFIASSAIFVGCSEHSKIVKSTDYDLKYKKAIEYYEAGDCYKALPLFEELMTYFRMTERGEDVYYYYANTQFCLKEYYLAAYYFKRFTVNYPNSPKAEECAFNSARCSMLNSPEYNLDQSDTYKAIDDFQLFMNHYPESGLVDSCNTLISSLRSKLETKSFEKAKLYYKMEKYRSAVILFNTTLEEFPDTDFKEEVLYLIIRSNFLFASNSIETKKEERYDNTIKSYYTFVDQFDSSKFLKSAESYFKSSQKELDKLRNVN